MYESNSTNFATYDDDTSVLKPSKPNHVTVQTDLEQNTTGFLPSNYQQDAR